MASDIKQSYFQAGTQGKHELYPVVPEEDRKLPFTFDNLNPFVVKQEHMELEQELGVESLEEWEEDPWLQPS